MIYMSAVVRWVVAVVVVVSIAGILTGKFPLKASPAQPSTTDHLQLYVVCVHPGQLNSQRMI